VECTLYFSKFIHRLLPSFESSLTYVSSYFCHIGTEEKDDDDDEYFSCVSIVKLIITGIPPMKY